MTGPSRAADAVGTTTMEGIDMTDHESQGHTLVTGIIGESFWVDKDGNPVPDSPSEQPTETPGAPSASDIWDAADKPSPGGGAGDFMPTGIVPDRSQEIGGPDDETQKEIWAEMERGEFGADAGKIPEDAETSI